MVAPQEAHDAARESFASANAHTNGEVRVEAFLHPLDLERLRQGAAKLDLPLNEYLRRALAEMFRLQEEAEKGSNIIIEARDGTRKKLLLGR